LTLQDAASSFVDLARLQLAARSLERHSPTIRVALLGLGRSGPLAARKLARVLLTDALADEQAWEQELLDSVQDGRSLLLRFGDTDEPTQTNPLMKTMHIPSPYLRQKNVEILVTALNTGDEVSKPASQRTLQAAILVPSLTTPNAGDGRVGFVRYPVHKAVLVAEGITGAVEYGALSSTLTDGTSISAALSVPLRPTTSTQSAEEESPGNAVDIDLADHALRLFRQDKANGAQFSGEWQTSRMSTLAEWIGRHDGAKATGLDPAVQSLVESVLSNTLTSISQTVATTNASADASTVPEEKRDALLATIADWSAASHRDLQLNLDSAFRSSPSWRRTAWWRLFWRIDDVTVSASDVLHRRWLNESEQGLAFVSGRIVEAGLATSEQLRSFTPQLLEMESQAEMAVHEALKTHTESSAQLTQMPSMLARMKQESGVNAQFNPPWPQTIALSRQYMANTLVPDLHRKAQTLLLTTLSTIGGSAALSGWFYLATGGVGLYESGAIVALGVVWSLRRLQKRWGQERDGFASAIREDARRVLGEVEGHLRKLVKDGGRTVVRVEDEKSWQEAREAVQRCQDALDKIKTT
jgi:hypothetical protein